MRARPGGVTLRVITEMECSGSSTVKVDPARIRERRKEMASGVEKLLATCSDSAVTVVSSERRNI